MKKFLSLLIVLCIFSVMPIAYAAETSISVTASDIDPETGVFYLSVLGTAKSLAVSISIDYDETKVDLYDADTDDGSTLIESEADGEYACKLPNSGMFSKVSLNLEDGYIKADWFKTSAVRADKEVMQIYFVAKDKTGANFNSDTFKLVTDADILSALKVAGNGGAMQWTDDNSVKYSSESTENTVATTFTYPNCDVEVGGGDPEPDPVYTWGSATDVVADEKDVTGTKVAVFGKVSGGAGKVLADNDYWVTFGQNTYYGKASTSAVTAWAIVIYDPNGTKVEADRTYGYTAGMTGVPSWTGSVTARAVAAE